MLKVLPIEKKKDVVFDMQYKARDGIRTRDLLLGKETF